MTTDPADIPLLVLGHPRCASRSVSALLKSCGLTLGHERMAEDGMVSWWHTAFHAGDGVWTNSGRKPARFRPRVVAHYIRNPLDAVPSILIENEHQGRDNNSFRHRTRMIRKWTGVDLDALDPLGAAAASYALWNDHAAGLSQLDAPIMIEAPEVGPLLDVLTRAGVAVTTPEALTTQRLNTTDRKFGVEKQQFSADDIRASVAGLGAQTQERLDAYFAMYQAD